MKRRIKMKKITGLLCTLLATYMLFVTPVMALPSQTANGEGVDATIDGQPLPEGTKLTFVNDFESVPQEEVASIEALNAGTEINEVLDTAAVSSPDGINVSEVKLLTKLQNLTFVDENGEQIPNATNVQATWEVPNLTTDLGNVYVLHYSTVRDVWEIITPDNVDANAKLVTATFKDLSPVAIVYMPAVNEGNGGTTSTGDTANVALYAGVAVVSLGVIGAIVYTMKKKNKAN